MNRKLCALLCIMLLAVSGCGTAPEAPEVTEEAERAVLTLAVLDLDQIDALKKLVEDYNALGGDIVEISEINSYETFRSSLYGDDAPDMFFVDMSDADKDMYSEYCEDLAPYLAGDPDYSAEDFVPTLYSGVQRGGALSWLPYDFTVFTYGVQPAIEGSDGGRVTVEQARAAAEERGEYMFTAVWVRDMLVDWIVPYLASAYVDFDSRTAYFDSPDFAGLLEACAEQPTSFDDIPEGSLGLLSPVWLGKGLGDSLKVVQSYDYRVKHFGEDYSFAGLPGEVSSGSMLVASNCFGISAASENKDAAWAFLRNLMGEDAQNAANAFPAIQSAFEARLAEQTKNFYITETHIDMVAALVEETTCVQQNSSVLEMIIRDGMNALFAGECTAQEAAAQIQRQAVEYLAGT